MKHTTKAYLQTALDSAKESRRLINDLLYSSDETDEQTREASEHILGTVSALEELTQLIEKPEGVPSRMTVLKDALMTSNHKVEELRELIGEKDKYNDELGQKIDDLEARLASKENSFNNMEVEKKALEGKIDEKDESIKFLENEIEMLKADLAIYLEEERDATKPVQESLQNMKMIKDSYKGLYSKSIDTINALYQYINQLQQEIKWGEDE